MSCLMHRVRSCAHTLRRDQESGMQAGVKIGMWKKLFKGWTVSFEVWSGSVDRGTESCKQAAQANRLTLVLEQQGGSRVWQP
jgi:hypothetical protein